MQEMKAGTRLHRENLWERRGEEGKGRGEDVRKGMKALLWLLLVLCEYTQMVCRCRAYC